MASESKFYWIGIIHDILVGVIRSRCTKTGRKGARRKNRALALTGFVHVGEFDLLLVRTQLELTQAERNSSFDPSLVELCLWNKRVLVVVLWCGAECIEALF